MSRSGPAYRYGLAVTAALVALFLRNLLTPLLGDQNPYHTVWLAVVFSSWYCGLGPSVVTAIVGAAGVWYWFLPPIHSFATHNRTQAFGMFGFLLFSAAIIALGESNRRGFAARFRLAAIVESSEDAIVSKDLNGIITSWNAGAQHMFGFTPEEAVGQPITLIIPPELQHEEEQILSRLRAGERIKDFETVRRNKNGSSVEVSLTISPLRNSQGQVIGASKIARDITGRKQAERTLKEHELSARLLRLQDEERRRIARELHDGVGQLIAAMSINASKIAQEKLKLSQDAARCAEENCSLIEEAGADVRTVSYLLHPPLLDDIGLESALKWYIEGFAERSKIVANLELSNGLQRLPQEYELCLFRVTQECLTNIHRHSGASTAQIKLAHTSAEIKLEVRDNGRGIDQELQSKVAGGEGVGVGLRGMRERLRQLGGGLEIQSDGKGTVVIATLPFQRPRAASAGAV